MDIDVNQFLGLSSCFVTGRTSISIKLIFTQNCQIITPQLLYTYKTDEVKLNPSYLMDVLYDELVKRYDITRNDADMFFKFNNYTYNDFKDIKINMINKIVTICNFMSSEFELTQTTQSITITILNNNINSFFELLPELEL